MFTIFPFKIATKIYYNKHIDNCNYYSIYGICEDSYNGYCGKSLELEDFDEDDVCSHFWFPRCVIMSSSDDIFKEDVKNNWEKVVVIAKTNPEIINYL